jgi:hypothetical protein
MGVVFRLFAFFISFLVCISLPLIYLSLIVVYSSRQFILANRAIPGDLLEATLAENKLEVTVMLQKNLL